MHETEAASDHAPLDASAAFVVACPLVNTPSTTQDCLHMLSFLPCCADHPLDACCESIDCTWSETALHIENVHDESA